MTDIPRRRPQRPRRPTHGRDLAGNRALCWMSHELGSARSTAPSRFRAANLGLTAQQLPWEGRWTRVYYCCATLMRRRPSACRACRSRKRYALYPSAGRITPSTRLFRSDLAPFKDNPRRTRSGRMRASPPSPVQPTTRAARWKCHVPAMADQVTGMHSVARSRSRTLSIVRTLASARVGARAKAQVCSFRKRALTNRRRRPLPLPVRGSPPMPRPRRLDAL